jgi:hypothetical protein
VLCQRSMGYLPRLPAVNSLEEFEQQFHQHRLDCNGIIYYPSTKTCSVLFQRTSCHTSPIMEYRSLGLFWSHQVQQLTMHGDAVAFGGGLLCFLPGRR